MSLFILVMQHTDFEKYIKRLLTGRVMTSFEIVKTIKRNFPEMNLSTLKSWILRSPNLISTKPVYFEHNSYGYTIKNQPNSHELISEYRNSKNNFISVLKNIFKERKFITAHTFCKICNISNIDETAINKKIEILNKFIRNSDVWFDGNFIIRGDIKIIPDITTDFFIDIRKKLFINKIIAFKHNNENLININYSNFYGFSNKDFYIPKCLYFLRFDGYARSLSYISDNKRKSYAVYDFAILDKYTIDEAKIFLNKVYKLRKYNLLILPFCVFKEADDEVLAFLRRNGLISICYKDYLGSEYESSISSLQEIIEGYNDLFQTVAHIEKLAMDLKLIGIFEQTKGYLFEYIMYRLLNDFYHTKPRRNVHQGKGKDGAQFDMIIETGKADIFCECKCNKEKIGFGTLDKGRINTIAHTINKIAIYNTVKEKKMLYISTSGYKRMTEENSKLLVRLCPDVSPSKSNCLFDLESGKDEITQNNWYILSKKLFNPKNN